ncbi:TNF receptor-associated factor 5-like, partial [Stylophora pistillata]|uniref:TNF receptor-associated factor 5-like n=1 Tax=Stylophora pistillata TaxID=50429 RepID=UPI000C0518B5
SHSSKCPLDREPLSRDKIFLDVACHREILNLTVKCSHVGCPWKGELRAVQKHQSECPFEVVECPNTECKEKVVRRDMDNHKTKECVWRKVSCEYCQESFIMKDKQQHDNVCQKVPVPCSNNCGLRNIPREKLVAHIRDDCPLTEVYCKYKNVGCREVFRREGTKSHLESHMESHLNLALCGLEMTQNQVNNQSQQIANLTATVQGLVQQIEILKGQDRHKATKKALRGLNKKGATNVKVKGSKFRM